MSLLCTVPRTAAKSLISLLTFCLGVVNTMKMDQLFQRRGLHTSIGGKVKEMILTILLLFVPLLVLIVYVGSLYVVATIAVFSWSWTGESAQPHHYLFLLPIAPFLLALLVQFLLFREYVKPSTASELSFAFLSAIIPVRVYLIKDQTRAFKYYILSLANIWASAILSFLALLAAMYNLDPSSEDKDHHLFTFTLEVFFPLFLWGIHLMVTSSLLLWYFVILPNLTSLHSFPAYQDLSTRLSSFPSFWSFHVCDLVLQERLKTQIWEEGECDFEMSLDQWAILEQVLEKRKNQDSDQTAEMMYENNLRDCLDNSYGKESKAQENLLSNLKKTKLMQ